MRASVLLRCFDIRYDLALTFAPGSQARLNLSRLNMLVSSEHVSEAVHDAQPLIQRCVAQMKAGVLHRQRDGFVMTLCEPISGK
jgi:hypothetical protein